MDVNAAQLEVGARSETGYVRDENQDRMSGTEVPLGHLYIVADGMGGHTGGALAAELAVQELQRHINAAPVTASVEQVIQAAFTKANEATYQKGHSGDPATEGMGTTAVLLLISGSTARIAHVGDSRAYLYRNGRLTQLTTDHTIVQKMVRTGMLKLEETADHPNASVLERAIGTHPTVDVDIGKELRLTDGDAILLCSDGLSGYVANSEIESVIRSQATVQEITEDLVRLALQKGGKDNVTVQFVQYGTRKEAQALKATKPTNFAAPVAHKARLPLQMVATVVLVAALSASGVYVFQSSKITELEAASKAEVETVYENLSKLHKALQDAQSASQNAAKEVEDLKGQLTMAGQSAKRRVGELQKELRDAQTASQTAEKEVNRLKKQLAKIEQSASQQMSKLQKELEESKTAETKAKAEANGLRTKLEETERELQEAKKQIQTLRSQGGQSQESETVPVTERAAAPWNTGKGATAEPKETPDAK